MPKKEGLRVHNTHLIQTTLRRTKKKSTNFLLSQLGMRGFSLLASLGHRHIQAVRLLHTRAMQTRVQSVDPANFTFATVDSEFPTLSTRSVIRGDSDQRAINDAVELLKAGEAVGIPTETVYGLAANALSAEAVAKIFAAKNRPQDNPLIVHVSSLEMLKSILPDQTVPKVYLPVIQRYWPGPLTIILPTSTLIPPSVTCNQPTVAVRFPSHPVARALIEACGFPLAAPSANSSGKPSPTLASHVYDDLKGRIPLILDGGPCGVGVESTVLDGLRTPPAILRPGGITYERLCELPSMNSLQVYRKDFVDKQLELAPTTPGMKYRHYSPEAKVVLFEHREGVNFGDRWKRELHDLVKHGAAAVKRVGILETVRDDEDIIKEARLEGGIEYISLQMGRHGQPKEVARDMFKGLRELDARQVDLIFVQGIPETDEGMAVMNRLRKAASKTIDL